MLRFNLDSPLTIRKAQVNMSFGGRLLRHSLMPKQQDDDIISLYCMQCTHDTIYFCASRCVNNYNTVLPVIGPTGAEALTSTVTTITELFHSPGPFDCR